MNCSLAEELVPIFSFSVRPRTWNLRFVFPGFSTFPVALSPTVYTRAGAYRCAHVREQPSTGKKEARLNLRYLRDRSEG